MIITTDRPGLRPPERRHRREAARGGRHGLLRLPVRRPQGQVQGRERLGRYELRDGFLGTEGT